MLKPNKFTDAKNCVVYNSYKILSFLKGKKGATYNEVLKNQIDIIGDDAIHLFLLSLDFLFVLGKIKYSEENDFLEIDHETK